LVRQILQNKPLWIVIHLIIGFLATLPFFPKFFGVLIVLLPVFIIYKTKNGNEEAFLFAAYIASGEVFLRMTKAYFLYETGKYAVILFLTMGFLLGPFKQKFAPQYAFYVLLLLLGIVFTSVPEGESIRKAIVFNLSGPICLGIAALYFYQRPISNKNLKEGLFFMLLPICSMIVYLYFRTPDLKEIVFGGAANFKASGGFGPNQVATAIGLGILVLTILILFKYRITGFLPLDLILLIYFVYRALLTFSRGGSLTAVISLLSFLFFYIIFKNLSVKLFIQYLSIILFLSMSIWIYTSNVTGGMLNNRYTGKDGLGRKKVDVTSGRIAILETQFGDFFDYPLGIGVGSGKYKRKEMRGHVTAASHNEIGRLIEEHGIIGVVILLVLLIVPLFNFYRGNYYEKAFTISFYLFWFLTINHSAMRIALPGFIYGLSLIRIVPDEAE